MVGVPVPVRMLGALGQVTAPVRAPDSLSGAQQKTPVEPMGDPRPADGWRPEGRVWEGPRAKLPSCLPTHPGLGR